MAQDNKSLGKFILDGIPPAPRGTPQIEVTFDIDANGILHVSAQDKGTGKKQDITITGSSGLSEEEIEQMKKEAEEHSDEDKKKKEAAEVRNQAEATVIQIEKLLSESSDKMNEEDKNKLQEKLDALKQVKDGEDSDDIKSKMDDLNQVAQDIGQKIYQQQSQEAGQEGQQGDQGQEGAGQGEQAEQGPVEGEYEDPSTSSTGSEQESSGQAGSDQSGEQQDNESDDQNKQQ